jgi:hypothetical protein
MTMVSEPKPGTAGLQRGDPVPHFRVVTVDDQTVQYSTIWQRRNLVLVTLIDTDSAPSRRYVSQLSAATPAFQRHETECVITRDVVAGVASPSVVIADRWGEILCVASASSVPDLPRLPEILEWAAYLQTRCPECEGETR